MFAWLGEQGSDFLPLHFRQQRTRTGHWPSFGAADFAYRSSEKTQLPSFQNSLLGYATACKLKHSKNPNRPLRTDGVGRTLSVGRRVQTSNSGFYPTPFYAMSLPGYVGEDIF